MKSPLAVAGALWTTFGVDGARRRATFEVRKRFGRLRTDAPPVPKAVTEAGPPAPWPFRPNDERLRRDAVAATALARADRVLAGEYHAYRAIWRRRPATPDEWNVDLETGFRYDARAPWFRIPLGTNVGAAPVTDIKDAWEPGRFGWAYDLARAWLLTERDEYAEAFWAAVESFRSGCPPFRGVQWTCGQETAVRALALLWCEATMATAPATTAARQRVLRELLYASGHRIADALDYGMSQRNNHGISECAGLIAVGARFRGVDRDADRWWRDGRELLERQVLDQFGLDGWYAQHSFTYLRVALDQLVQAERVLRLTGDGLGTLATERVRTAVQLFARVLDADSGDMPNHGANDGAFVLPLTTGEFRDFRPSLIAAAATFQVSLPPGVQPDGETLAWLNADPPPNANGAKRRVVVGDSGWLDARTDGARIFARAGTYRSRPSHIDALHLDVWIDGRAIAVDAGTYRYVGAWARPLSEEFAHNMVTIEGWPMAERGPRFLWLRWPRSVIASFRDEGTTIICDLLNESWRTEGIAHRRTCRVVGDGVTVLDEVTLPVGRAARASIHWLLDGDPENVAVLGSVPSETSIRHGDDHSPYGWIAESYAVLRPATSLRLQTRDRVTRVRFASGFGSARDRRYLQAVLAHGINVTGEASRLSQGAVH